MYRCRLRDNYDNDFEKFDAYAEMYGLHTRLGFETTEEAWEANPMIQGSVIPEDFRVVKPEEMKRSTTCVSHTDEEFDALGRCVIAKLGLKVNKNGRINTEDGDKTAMGLGKTIVRWAEENGRVEYRKGCPRN